MSTLRMRAPRQFEVSFFRPNLLFSVIQASSVLVAGCLWGFAGCMALPVGGTSHPRLVFGRFIPPLPSPPLALSAEGLHAQRGKRAAGVPRGDDALHSVSAGLPLLLLLRLPLLPLPLPLLLLPRTGRLESSWPLHAAVSSCPWSSHACSRACLPALPSHPPGHPR